MTTTRTQRLAALILLTLLALGLRLYGVSWGLPSETECLRSYHPDEAAFIASIKYVQNPFRYPHFNLVMGTWHLYTTGAAVKLGSLLGWFTLTSDRGYYERHLGELDRLYLCGRLVSVVMGTLCIPLLYLLGKVYYSRNAGLAAAAILAVTGLHVVDSHYFYTGVPVLFWSLIGWIFLARLQCHPRAGRRDLVGAGFFFALASMVQFNAGLLLMFVPVAVWLRHRTTLPRLRWKAVAVVAGAAFIVGTIVACPNAWFDPAGFYEHFSGYLTGHFAGEKKATTNYQGSALVFYGVTALMESFGPVLYVGILFGLAALAVRRANADWFHLLFLLANFALLARNDTYMTHYVVLALPSLILPLGALFAALRRPLPALGLGLALGFFGFSYSLAYDQLLAAPDVRTVASRWLEATVPPGTTVGVNQVYFYSLPAIQRVSGSPYQVIKYNQGLEQLRRDRPEYFIVCDFEFGIANRVLHDEYKPEYGGAKFYKAILGGNEYRLVREFRPAATFGGLDWTPPDPSWHWNYPTPRVQVFRRAE